MFAISTPSSSGTTLTSSGSSNNSITASRQARTSRACEGCRRRKIKCSGGLTCESCAKSNEPCKYRQHYRALKGYPIKIISNPGERVKRRKSSSAASSMSAAIGVLSISSSSPNVIGGSGSLPVDISRIPSQSSISSTSTATLASGSSPPSSYSSSTSSSYGSPLFKSNPFSSPQQQKSGIDSLDPKSRLPSISNFQNMLAPITPPPSTTSFFFGQSGNAAATSTSKNSFSFTSSNKNISNIDNTGSNNNSHNTLHLQLPQLSSSYSSYSTSTSFQTLPSIVAQSPAAARKQASMRMAPHKSSAIPATLHLTEEQMLQCLSSYFNIYQPLFPMLDPEAWIRKAKTAWRSLESRQVLSFNQIELAIVYTLVALGARESAPALFLSIPAADWAFEYYDRTMLIIPNVFEVPTCLLITQYMLLASMFTALVDRARSHKLATAAFRTATALGLHTLTDSTRYANIPALNASESYRTFVSAHLWSQVAALAAGSSPAEYSAPVALNPRAFSDIGYHNVNILTHRLKMIEIMRTVPTATPPRVEDVEAGLARTLGDRSRYLQPTPPALVSSGIASQLNRSVGTREWLHYRLLYWVTEVIQYRPFLVAAVAAPNDPQWSAGAAKCLGAATELYQLVAHNTVASPALLDAWLFSAFAELSLAIYLFRAVAGDSACLAQFRECADFVGLADREGVFAGLRTGLGWREVAQKLFGQDDGTGARSPHSKAGSPAAKSNDLWNVVISVLQ